MSNRKHRRNVKKMVIPNLNKITNFAKEQAKLHGVERIPMKMIYMIIDEGKVGHTQDETSDAFISAYNLTLKQIKSLCKDSSDSIGDGCISPLQVELIIEAVKGAFLDGIKNSN